MGCCISKSNFRSRPDEERQTSSPQPDHLLLPETFRDFEGDELEIDALFWADEESPLRPGMKLGYAKTVVRKMTDNLAAKYGTSRHVTPSTPKYEVLAVGKAKAALSASFEVAVKLRNLENGGEEVWKVDSKIWERFEETH